METVFTLLRYFFLFFFSGNHQKGIRKRDPRYQQYDRRDPITGRGRQGGKRHIRLLRRFIKHGGNRPYDKAQYRKIGASRKLF